MSNVAALRCRWWLPRGALCRFRRSEGPHTSGSAMSRYSRLRWAMSLSAESRVTRHHGSDRLGRYHRSSACGAPTKTASASPVPIVPAKRMKRGFWGKTSLRGPIKKNWRAANQSEWRHGRLHLFEVAAAQSPLSCLKDLHLLGPHFRVPLPSGTRSSHRPVPPNGR